MLFIPFYLAFTSSTVYFEERFDSGWETRWKRPDHVKKGIQLGKVRVSAGDYYGDEKIQRGLETMESRRFYLLYSNFSHTFDTREKDLIIQYTLRLNLYVDCSGYYIKLFDSSIDPEHFSNESVYSIMFGPDICGAVRKKTHIILSKDGKYYPYIRGISCYKDHLTHAYTLVIRKNGTIEYRVDGEIIDAAPLDMRFSVPMTKEVPDASDKKPSDWEDDRYIVDPEDKKPSDWVDEEFIPDPDSFRPPSWDESIPWAPPMIKNPDYKGEWKPNMIPNPKYKGVWMPKTIKTSEPVDDPTFGKFPDLAFIGLEFYQSSPGSIFDNFLVTDDEEYAKKALEETFFSIRDEEVRCFDRMSNKATEEKELEKYRNRKERDMKEREKLKSDSISETEKEKETPEMKKLRRRKAKKELARKRAERKGDVDL
ncbi:Calreticulin [Tritrichomonas foetus]|uniref:Calreticulin n=1 Tax=Tritrichomonas foetus TaxID=1144522 RepID=A0A1J4KMB5_9EUKA|nr:Calreticulin [Tritrichomonas foetus]|eukprot:OHT10940.1 Calreticulin [Tritrichomonas foetus]